MKSSSVVVLLPTSKHIASRKRLPKRTQSTKLSRTSSRISISNQTYDEGSEETSSSGPEYESSSESSASVETEQPAASSPPPRPSGRSPEYIIMSGKLCLKSKIKPYACTHVGCGKAYRKPSRLEEHERSHTGERPFQCITCQKSYLRESHLRAHSRSHLPPSARPFVCTHQIIVSKKRINQDLLSTQREPVGISGPSTSPTQICNQRFWTAQHLQAHELAIHMGEKPYKCTSCPAAFSKHGALRAHNAENHAPPGTKPYRCEQSGCNQSFTTNQKLKTHSRVHDATRYACAHPDCSRAGSQNPVQFATWTALQAHMRSDHPPKCPYESCHGRTFASSKGLKSHLKTHEDREKEEKHVLNLSGSTNAPGSKRARVELEQAPEPAEPPPKRRRGGEVGRDWPCPQDGCDKAFKSKKAQNDHVRVSHEGSRNFSCPKAGCTLAFGYKHVMQRHLERHHHEITSGTGATLPIPQAQAPSTISFLTGQKPVTNRPRIIACPWPDAFQIGAMTRTGVEAGQARCTFKFSRAYDLRRHLKSVHGLEAGADEVAAWVLERKR